MHLGGCHATIFLLGTGALTDCPGEQLEPMQVSFLISFPNTTEGWSQRCLQTYLERCHKCKCGLANAHLAFVADPTHPVVSNHQVVNSCCVHAMCVCRTVCTYMYVCFICVCLLCFVCV